MAEVEFDPLIETVGLYDVYLVNARTREVTLIPPVIAKGAEYARIKGIDYFEDHPDDFEGWRLSELRVEVKMVTSVDVYK